MEVAYALAIGDEDGHDASTLVVEVHHTNSRMAIIVRDPNVGGRTTWIPRMPEAAHVAELVAAQVGIALLGFEASEALRGDRFDFCFDEQFDGEVAALAEQFAAYPFSATVVATIVDETMTDLSTFEAFEHVDLVVCRRA